MSVPRLRYVGVALLVLVVRGCSRCRFADVGVAVAWLVLRGCFAHVGVTVVPRLVLVSGGVGAGAAAVPRLVWVSCGAR